MADADGEYGLDCPFPSCEERFHSYHDEPAVTTLVYHLKQDHPQTYEALRWKLGGRERGVDA